MKPNKTGWGFILGWFFWFEISLVYASLLFGYANLCEFVLVFNFYLLLPHSFFPRSRPCLDFWIMCLRGLQVERKMVAEKFLYLVLIPIGCRHG